MKTIKHADYLVTKIKGFSRTIGEWNIPDDIDFKGCSEYYVQEKIALLESDLNWLKERLKKVGKK